MLQARKRRALAAKAYIVLRLRKRRARLQKIKCAGAYRPDELATYAQRISDLKNGGGFNGTNRLVVNTTVLGGGADTLKGKGPHDWFFEFPGDTILGFVPGEQIN